MPLQRFSERRKLIREYITQQAHTFCAQDVLDWTQKHITPTPHKTTIYREIESLIQEKYIQKVFTNDQGITFFENNNHHHHHAICSQCQKCEHISCSELEPFIHSYREHLKKKHGFTLMQHTFEIQGICKSCNKQNS